MTQTLTLDREAALARLLQLNREAQTLGSVGAVLHWDQETMMPPKAVAARAEQLSLLAAVTHQKATLDEIGDLLETLRGPAEAGELDPVGRANVREIRRSYERRKKLPTELVAELARVQSLSQEAWVKARATSAFDEFAPWLERILDLQRQVADRIGYTTERYDALLDEYEPGVHASDLEPLFAKLREALVPIVRGIAAAPEPRALTGEFPVEKQRELGLSVAKAMGFDFDAGRLDISVHPFCTSFHPSDVRLTTRYSPTDVTGSLFGTMHETGHGLYEQGLDAEHAWTPVGGTSSLGIHESQSRLWENQVGRSRAFWSHWYPKLIATFPEALGKVSLDDYYRAINCVKPSFIRVEADEVTYNLHILLRFEIERALFDGQLAVSDLPKTWNAKMVEYLGVEPPDDAHGVLQDVHWSFGLFGYFPTYTLGNLYAAQLFAAAGRAMPDLDEQIARGELLPLREWLRVNLHQKGQLLLPPDLLKEATGESLKVEYFITYLREKFGALYGLQSTR
ncbi:MAG: carboxypeptidase M32 [Chloroflexi bacterium]|nr:carboxypeptidase M32 [Chloroflexota bacterium]